MILPSKHINSPRVYGFVGGKDFGVCAFPLQLKNTYVMDSLSFCATGGLLHRVSLISLCGAQAKHLLLSQGMGIKEHDLIKKVIMANIPT